MGKNEKTKKSIRVNEQAFFNEILYEWSIEPFIGNSDNLRPG